MIAFRAAAASNFFRFRSGIPGGALAFDYFSLSAFDCKFYNSLKSVERDY